MAYLELHVMTVLPSTSSEGEGRKKQRRNEEKSKVSEPFGFQVSYHGSHGNHRKKKKK